MRLSGKTVLVTGGTDGIGAQIIRQLRDKGANVIASGRNPERIAATRADGFEVIEADLATSAGIKTLTDALDGRTIDILLNNAGALVDHDFRVASPDPVAADATIFLNLDAPIHLICALMPMLQTRPEAAIVNVTSGLAMAPASRTPVYCATKAGLRSYTQALRRQLKGSRIRVHEALLPVVDTQMNAGRSGAKMPAAECARQIVAGIERGKEEINVGMVKLLQVIHSISPALVRSIMIRF